MDSAFDTVLGIPIRAIETPGSRDYERYLCRSCQKYVYYVEGGTQVSHFRHFKKVEDEFCAARVAAIEREPFSAYDLDQVDVVLACRIYESKHGQECCYFILYRPRREIQRVLFQQEDVQTRYQISEGCSERQLPILHRCKQYCLKEFDSFEQSHVQITEGFSSPVVFRRSEGRSVRLPQHRMLRAGGYLAVFTTEPSSFPTALKPEVIPSALGLYVVGFVIPPRPELRDVHFLREVLGMEVKVLHIDYAISKPVILEEVAPDCWATPNEGSWRIRLYCDPTKYISPVSFLIRKRSTIGASKAEVMTFEGRDGFYDIELELNLSSASVIHVGLGNMERADFIFEIRLMPTLLAPQCAKLALTFSKETKKTACYWSSHSLKTWLRQVSMGEKVLREISIPRGTKLSTVFAGKLDELSESNACSKVTHMLRQLSGSLTLRASGYPDVQIKDRKFQKTGRVLRNHDDSLIDGQVSPAMQQAYVRGVISAYAANSRRTK